MTSIEELDILNADIDDIYLGNLGTVDCDMNLPLRGKRGSTFIWTSGERLFLSDTGKVTRPTFGVGDRDVRLYLTATYGESSEEREYTVTVLQEQPETTITSVDDVHVIAFAGHPVTLPSVAVAHLSDGGNEVRPIIWGTPEDVAPTETGDIRYAQGHIEGWMEPVDAVVTFVFLHPGALPRNDAQSSSERFLRSRASYVGGGALGRKISARLEFLHGVDENRMLYNFRAAADLDTRGVEPMTGWDNPEGNLRGHTTGHFLSALALAYACTGDCTIRAKIDRMVAALAECQHTLHESKGYSWGFLSGYSEEQFDLLEEYVTYPTIWAPYYTFDKIVSGLLDCYEYAGNRQALDIALRMGFWVNRRLGRLSKPQRDRMWSIYIAGEYGGIISALIRLHRITGDSRFVTTAGCFHNDKLLYPMGQGVDTLGGMHANQHIPQIIGAIDCATFGDDMDGLDVASNFWHIVTEHHMYAIGGVGETEMFHAPDRIAAYLTDKSAESCATYNLSKLAMRLFEASPNAAYADYYEHALINQLTPATHTDADGGTVYFFPTRPGARLSFDTDENTCCHGTGFESMFRFEEHIVKGTADKAFVNLYMGAQVEACGGALRCRIEQGDGMTYIITFDRLDDVHVLLRRPAWADTMQVLVDGEPTSTHDASEPGYVRVDKPLMSGTVVTVMFDASLRTIDTPDDPSVAALAYGPYVLAGQSASEEFIAIGRERIEEIASCQGLGLDVVCGRLAEETGIPFRPLCEVDDEPYHVYVRLS